jgi:hypothetical protein
MNKRLKNNNTPFIIYEDNIFQREINHQKNKPGLSPCGHKHEYKEREKKTKFHVNPL